MQLLVNEGKRRGALIAVTGKIFTIGRDETCQLRPCAAEVSRFHAELKLDSGLVIIRDLGSSNGTRVNGQPLTAERPLSHGDRVEIGPLSFTVVMEQTRPGKRPRRSGEDEVAAWLIGEAEEDSQATGLEVPAGATVVTPTGADGPRSAQEPPVTSPTSEANDTAYDLLRSMSLTEPETN